MRGASGRNPNPIYWQDCLDASAFGGSKKESNLKVMIVKNVIMVADEALKMAEEGGMLLEDGGLAG